MKHKVLLGIRVSVKLDSRLSIFKYIQNYHDINVSGFNKVIMYDI